MKCRKVNYSVIFQTSITSLTFFTFCCPFFVPDNAPRYGTVRRLGREPQKVNGHVRFDDSLEVEIDVQDLPKRTVKLDKLNINTKQIVGVRVSYTVIMHQDLYSVSVLVQILAF